MIYPTVCISNHLKIGDAVTNEAGHGFSDIVLQGPGSIQQSESVILIIDVPGDEVAAHLNLSSRRMLTHFRSARALRHSTVKFGRREQHFGVLRCSTDD